jgi:acyl-CoA synthetase (NDP forming)
MTNLPALKRLLAPRTIALFGSGWADAVDASGKVIGFRGEVWRIHPKRPSTAGVKYFRSIDELPGAPDASFVAAPAREVPAIAEGLATRGAGGFVCFASGFSETGTDEGKRLTTELVAHARDLPFFGPNCYGFINFFDQVALWPDQVVGRPSGSGTVNFRVDRGVAIICQSGTLALNILFNGRSLPIGYVLTVGNQTSLAVEDMIELLADDERVTAFGLYVEGVKDTTRFARAVTKARAAGKPIALVKAGRTEAAARTAHTHTGSLAGADTVFDSFCRQAGIARCESLATLCETLKVFHTGGPLRGRRVMIMGASGGDMAMTADASRDLGLTFPAFPPSTAAKLQELLTDKVTVANPFDFHTHIWFDAPAMNSMFSMVHQAGFDAAGFMLDCPPEDQADPAAYVSAIDQFIATFPGLPTRSALISAMPESMSPTTREKCLAAGIMPLQGQREALEALNLAGEVGETWASGANVELRLQGRANTSASGATGVHGPRANSGAGPAALAGTGGVNITPDAVGKSTRTGRAAAAGAAAGVDINASAAAADAGAATADAARASLVGHDSVAHDSIGHTVTLTEHAGKAALAAYGVNVPRSKVVAANQAAKAAQDIGFPVVIKASGAHLEHKSELGAVVVNIRTAAEAEAAAKRLSKVSDTLLVEQMIADGVAEIIVGMTVDAQFGQVLVIGAGGILTELLRDTVTLLPPFTAPSIEAALNKLKVSKLLKGFRGKPAGDVPALIDTILACTRYAEANVNTLVELDINPVIVRPAGNGATAVDALIRLAGNPAESTDDVPESTRSNSRSRGTANDRGETQSDVTDRH